MIEVDLKSLISKLNPHTTHTLNQAAGATLSRGHYEVTIEHHLHELLEDPASDLPLLLNHFSIDPARLRRTLDRHLETLKTGNTGRPVFSPWLVEWFQDAWMIGSIEFGLTRIRSGSLLAALVLRRSRYGASVAGEALKPIQGEALRRDFQSLISSSNEGAPAGSSAASEDGDQELAAPGDDSALGRFTINLTAQARQGRIDPIFGRDREIRQMIDILARRRKNNPICVGEPGVGKTAVVEGFALAVAEGQVPHAMKDVEVLSLDMGLLQAGAGVRGEFENRLKSVISEVKASPKPIVLFIDEAHTLIGAGGGAGAGDAANLLKPSLARGELRTIAATTWKEYKKYFEKDPALARRFELVKIPEPTPQQAIGMLRGLASRYAQSHGVHIRDEAVVAAVELSHRYISGRLLPDKAVGLLDTCAARVRIGQSAVPSDLLVKRGEVASVERELAAHEADLQGAAGPVEDRRTELQELLARLNDEAAALEARWNQERELVEQIIALREQMHAPATDGGEDAAPPDPVRLKADLHAAVAALAGAQSESPLVHAEVDPDAVAQVVADWTGIPVGKVVKDEAAAVVRFEAEMGRRIKGQDHALAVIGERIRQAKAGLQDPSQPQAVFLLVGPSGVGKTETALGLADLLYGGERSVVSINMSEFQEKHTVSRLVGSPPGYVGYGEGGVLTEAVRQRPYSVVLLDECEKADREVLDIFYQVFDKGTLSDGEGREVDFKNTVIILTSNLATEQITAVLDKGFPDDHETLVHEIRPELSRHFKPALLARMTVVPYYPLPKDTLRMITDLKLGKVARRMNEEHRIKLTWTDAVGDAIAARCTEVETGARNVDHIIRGTMMPLLAREVLSRIGDEVMPEELRVDVGPDGTFQAEAIGLGAPVQTA